MSFGESIVVSIFSMALVFSVLAILCGMVKVLSLVLTAEKTEKAEKIEKADPSLLAEQVRQDWDSGAGHAASGELRLINVDEKTAAIIMAIVSDESQIPVSELRFKSIAAID